jgi:glutamyl-tRNA(Gln) amidotransferase subunit D
LIPQYSDILPYLKNILKLLKTANIEVGDKLEISTNEGGYEGILMPHHEFSKDDIITIKLESGYNIGIEMHEEMELKLIEKGIKQNNNINEIPQDKNKPIISILGTGGTIASYIDYRTGAVHPALSASDLVNSVPELAEVCNIEAKVLFSIFSEDMHIKHWQKIANEVTNELNKGAQGVIIPHGTDTMGYTAAALSFMLDNLTGPVILVGAQRSSDRPSTDANQNLLSAATLATKSDLAEVVIMMHEGTSDCTISIHRGTRVRKMHTSTRDAFRSVNENPIGSVKGGKVTLKEPYKKRCEGKVKVDSKMEKAVSMFYSHPGVSPDYFDYLAEKNKGIVLIGTGLGHVPHKLQNSIEYAISQGIAVVITSQCLFGGVNMKVYSSGRDLISKGVISGDDMLPETAFVKLSWVLGHTTDPEAVREAMNHNLRGEINTRHSI